MELGLSLFFLASFRKNDVKTGDVFLGFAYFGKALGLWAYRFIFIVLWTCLFIIPGIIAAIRYSQAFFILADNPDKSITQCMDESKAMMRGNLWQYFILVLSFIGWYILSAFPAAILIAIGEVCTTNEFVLQLLTFIGDLFVVPVIAYVMSTFVGFYEILAGHLIKATRPVPVTPVEARHMQSEFEQSSDPKSQADTDMRANSETQTNPYSGNHYDEQPHHYDEPPNDPERRDTDGKL